MKHQISIPKNMRVYFKKLKLNKITSFYFENVPGIQIGVFL